MNFFVYLDVLNNNFNSLKDELMDHKHIFCLSERYDENAFFLASVEQSCTMTSSFQLFQVSYIVSSSYLNSLLSNFQSIYIFFYDVNILVSLHIPKAQR